MQKEYSLYACENTENYGWSLTLSWKFLYLFVYSFVNNIITGEPKHTTSKEGKGTVHPVISVKWSIHCALLSAVFNLLHSRTNQCNQSSHYEKYGQFPLQGSHMLPPNWHFSPSAKINGTQRRTLVSPWRMHCTKKHLWAEVMSVSRSVGRSVSQSVSCIS